MATHGLTLRKGALLVYLSFLHFSSCARTQAERLTGAFGNTAVSACPCSPSLSPAAPSDSPTHPVPVSGISEGWLLPVGWGAMGSPAQAVPWGAASQGPYAAGRSPIRGWWGPLRLTGAFRTPLLSPGKQQQETL